VAAGRELSWRAAFYAGDVGAYGWKGTTLVVPKIESALRVPLALVHPRNPDVANCMSIISNISTPLIR